AARTSAITAPRRDRRFADPAWQDNPLLKRAVQAYLAAGQTAEALLADAEMGWRDNERLTFLLGNLIAVAAPSNNPIISPVAWKALIDTGGLSAMRGIRGLLLDLAGFPRIPTVGAPRPRLPDLPAPPRTPKRGAPARFEVAGNRGSRPGRWCPGPRCTSSSS